MKKAFLFLLALIVVLPLVKAQTKIFSGKVLTDTDKLIEEQVFRVTYDEKNNKGFVQTPAGNLIIEKGACKSNIAFNVCIKSANFSHKNLTTYVYYYNVDVDIYRLTSSLSATSTAGSTTLLQGEQTEFAITIANPSEYDATSIVFKEELKPFAVTEAKGCNLDDTQISWQGSLKPKYEKVCKATIIAIKEGTHKLTGNLSYFNSYKTENKSTDTLAIKVLPKQLKVIYSVDKKIEIKSAFHVNISMQNIHQNDRIEALVLIEIPSVIVLLKDVEGFAKDKNTLKQKILLEQATQKNYSFYYIVSKETDEPIRHRFDYTIKNIKDVIENYTSVNVSEPQPIITFSSEHPEIQLGQKFLVSAKIKNPSNVHEFRDIKANLNVPYVEEINEKFDKLAPSESYFIISNWVILPQNADFGNLSTIFLNLSIAYKFNEQARFVNKSLGIKINSTIAPVQANTSQEKKQAEQAKAEKELSKEAGLQSVNATSYKLIQTEPKLVTYWKITMHRTTLIEKIVLLVLISAIVFGLPAAIYVIGRANRLKKIRKEAVDKILKDGAENNDKPKDF